MSFFLFLETVKMRTTGLVESRASVLGARFILSMHRAAATSVFLCVHA